jgi:DNA-binding NtrC family response regulator
LWKSRWIWICFVLSSTGRPEQVLLRHEAGSLGGLVQEGATPGIVAGSEVMRVILDTIRKVAPSRIPVLVTGESGTGKELIAQAVHDQSPRAKKRFVPVNCASQSENLIEDELFGHVKGAFTGADQPRDGVFEYADGGTIFLDEIGDMPLTMQAKLLRVLESGEVVRIGSNEPRRVDVRLVSATNRDLEAMVTEGSFREDLFFRIQGSRVHLPPLRDRREDIPRIVHHALARYAVEEFGQTTPVPEITDAALMRLSGYSWPGNVRQLLNTVRTMVVLAIGELGTEQRVTVGVEHIPDQIRQVEGEDAHEASTSTASLAGKSLEHIEKRAIRETLRLTGGNRERAASMLGIGERTLYRKLKEYGLR